MEPATEKETPPHDMDAARAYWIKQAQNKDEAAAVHPKDKWLGYHAWARKMLQSWLQARIAADRPRYKRFVDLGCGPGDWAELFAPLADEVHACDVAPTFVDQARARLASHPSAHLSVADISTYEVPQGVDLIHFGAVLMYLTDDKVRDLMKRVHAASVSGAHLVIRDYCTINLGRRSINTSSGFSIHRSPREIREIATDAGFRCIEVRSSPSIYGEMFGGRVFQWPMRGLWRLATMHWLRSSYMFRFVA